MEIAHTAWIQGQTRRSGAEGGVEQGTRGERGGVGWRSYRFQFDHHVQEYQNLFLMNTCQQHDQIFLYHKAYQIKHYLLKLHFES